MVCTKDFYTPNTNEQVVIDTIREGQRVMCHKNGPFDGQRGEVVDVFAGQAVVDFGEVTLCDPVSSFRPL